MIKKEIQLRIKLNKLDKEEMIGKKFKFKYNNKDHEYTIEKLSNKSNLMPESLPMGVIVTGFTQQYIAKSNLNNSYCEIFVYFYQSFENDIYAIIDTIEI